MTEPTDADLAELREKLRTELCAQRFVCQVEQDRVTVKAGEIADVALPVIASALAEARAPGEKLRADLLALATQWEHAETSLLLASLEERHDVTIRRRLAARLRALVKEQG